MKLKTLLNFSLIIIPVSLLFLSLMQTRKTGMSYLDGYSIMLFMILILICFFLINLKFQSNIVNAYNIRLYIYIFMFFLLPFLGYFFFAKENLPYIGHRTIDSLVVNKTLILIIIGTVFLPLGFANSKLKRLKNDSIFRGCDTFRINYIIYIVIVMICFSLPLYRALTIPNYYTGMDTSAGDWWRRFFSFIPVTFMGTIYYLHNREHLSRKSALIIMLPIISWQIFLIFTGSRSSIVDYVILVLTYYLVITKKMYISKRILLIGLIVILIAIITYPIGGAMRYYWADLYNQGANINLYSMLDYVSNSYLKSFEIMFHGIFTRLSYFDHLLFIIMGPTIDPVNHIGLLHDIKAFINTNIPGDLWPNIIDSSSTYPILYMDIPVSQIVEYHKLTMPWQVWGLVYIYFGWALMVPAFYLIGYLSGNFIKWFISVVPQKYQIYALMWSFTIAFSIINNFGLDSFFSNIIHDIIPYLTIYPFLGLLIKKKPAVKKAVIM